MPYFLKSPLMLDLNLHLMTMRTKDLMRRLLLILMIAAAGLSGLFAAADQTGRVNYYADCMNDTEYASLLKHVFDDDGLDTALADYAVLMQTIMSKGYDDWVSYLMSARAALIVARYANDKDQKAVAEAYMNAADSFVETARSLGAPQSAAGVLEALSSSFWYLVDGSLSKGLAFGRIVGDLWDEHPEDFHVLLLTADKYLHSPGIAGGNKKKGLELYQLAEVVAMEEGCAVWDQFSIYAGLAVGYDKAKEDELAYQYALLARDIYSADPLVNEIISNYEG